MAYFSLISSRPSYSSSDDDDSGQGRDCLPEDKSRSDSSTSSTSSSSLASRSSDVKPTNYVSTGSSSVPDSTNTSATSNSSQATPVSNGSSTKLSTSPLEGPNGLGKATGEFVEIELRDTYDEDCKLARDMALNVLTDYQIPIFNGLRDCNQKQMMSTMKSLRKPSLGKKYFDHKEALVAYVILLDYLTCCSQEGNLLPLYENSKSKDTKRNQISEIDYALSSLVDGLKSKIVDLKQLRSMEQLVLASLDRIPKSLGMHYFSVKFALQRKLKLFEEEERNRLEKSEYNFDDRSPEPPTKKWRTSSVPPIVAKKTVVATSKNWREQTIPSSLLPKAAENDDSDDSDSFDIAEAKTVQTSTPRKETDKVITHVTAATDNGILKEKNPPSPYKSKKSTWNSSKYVSPAKQPISKMIQVSKKILDSRGDNIDNISRNRSLLKDNYIAKTSQAAATKCKSPNKVGTQVLARNVPGRSPLKVQWSKGNNASDCNCTFCRRAIWQSRY